MTKFEEKRYRVKEVFLTLQGEGFFSGRPAVFVRFVGCNMWTGREGTRERDSEKKVEVCGTGPSGRYTSTCAMFCDTDFLPAGSKWYTARELVAKVLEVAGEGGCRFVVCTGGEPLLQMDVVLMRTMRDAGLTVAVETNGTVSLERFESEGEQAGVYPDHITCSPKVPAKFIRLEWFNELKLVLPHYHPEDYEAILFKLKPTVVTDGAPIPADRNKRLPGHVSWLKWVQPCDGPDVDENVKLCVNWCLEHGDWRLSFQMHKAIGVD